MQLHRGDTDKTAEWDSEPTKGPIDWIRSGQSKAQQSRGGQVFPSQESAEPPGLLPTELSAQGLYPFSLKELKQWKPT